MLDRESTATKYNSGLSILIIEDNFECAYSLAVLLEHYGHRTIIAPDGTTGLEIAKEFAPDLVMLDIDMQETCSDKVAMELSGATSRNSPLVFALSGQDRAGKRGHAGAAGIDYYLIKPVDPTHLNAILQVYREFLRSRVVPLVCFEAPLGSGESKSPRVIPTGLPGKQRHTFISTPPEDTTAIAS